MTKKYRGRIIPHKDYSKELNKWLPCEPEYRVDIDYYGDVYMTFSNEKLMTLVCDALNKGNIQLHDNRKYTVVLDRDY